MKKTAFLIISMSITFLGYSQDFEKEIKNLRSPEEIQNYWVNLNNLDQSKRGINTDDTLDNNNFKKVILLIKYYGYPKGSRIPNIIATHQRAGYVLEYYFPILYQAYKSGEADTSWFFHNLRGIHRTRFGRDFIRGRKIEPKDVDTLIKRLSPFINTEIDLSIDKFDSLYNKYIFDLNSITNSEILYSWVTADKSHCFFYRFQNKIYYHLLYQDNSCTFPQEIKLNIDKNQYEYVDSFDNDFFIINDKSNLQIFKSGKMKEEVILID